MTLAPTEDNIKRAYYDAGHLGSPGWLLMTLRMRNTRTLPAKWSYLFKGNLTAVNSVAASLTQNYAAYRRVENREKRRLAGALGQQSLASKGAAHLKTCRVNGGKASGQARKRASQDFLHEVMYLYTTEMGCSQQARPRALSVARWWMGAPREEVRSERALAQSLRNAKLAR